MQTIEGFQFFPLEFDRAGQLESVQEFDQLVAQAESATDVVYLAHGFRNDAADAQSLYSHFLQTFRGHLARPEFQSVAARRFVIAGVFWPSKSFRESFSDESDGTRGLQNPADVMAHLVSRLEEMKRHDATTEQRHKLDEAIRLLPTLEGHPHAQDEFVALVLAVVKGTGDKTEGLPQIKKQSGSRILGQLAMPADTGTRGLGNLVGGIAGGVGQFLNLTTWFIMKERSGTVGATGVAKAVRDLHAAHPSIRTHLVGHSLGGRLMASCAKALAAVPVLQPDSLTLLEAAFSHFGFSPDNGNGTPGFFREVVSRQVVKGPFVSTFSAQDTVVGRAYTIMSHLAGDNSREIGDANDEFGGIGRNGPLRTTEVTTGPLHRPGKPYTYQAGVINNLDGSGGFIKDHSDVTNDAVTYAFASAISRT